MFAAIGEIVLRCNADSVAARTRMQRTEWLSRHVYRLAGHLLDGFLVFLILCCIAEIFIGITRAVLSRMGPDSDDRGEAEDDVNGAVAKGAETHDAQAHDTEAHDTQTHDPKAHETEIHDTEPPATNANDSDVTVVDVL